MDYTRNFGTPHETLAPRMLCQDATNSSEHWRQHSRTYHPLTERQFGNTYRVGEKVKLRLRTHNGTGFINATVVHASQYIYAQQFLGSYNLGDTFNGAPFTHVLVLDH
jgi:hypothetical protein